MQRDWRARKLWQLPTTQATRVSFVGRLVSHSPSWQQLHSSFGSESELLLPSSDSSLTCSTRLVKMMAAPCPSMRCFLRSPLLTLAGHTGQPTVALTHQALCCFSSRHVPRVVHPSPAHAYTTAAANSTKWPPVRRTTGELPLGSRHPNVQRLLGTASDSAIR